jgi:hypothetical protein
MFFEGTHTEAVCISTVKKANTAEEAAPSKEERELAKNCEIQNLTSIAENMVRICVSS